MTGRILMLLLLSAATAAAQFRDVSKEIGFSGDGKAAFADYDNDGFVDVFAGGRLLRNEQAKRFNVVEGGPSGGEGIWGDYDSDGLIDLFIFTGTGTLYRNMGAGKFESVEFPKLPTVNSRGAVWFDLNNDGHLDLYVGGYEEWQKAVHPDVVFMNEGKGGFKEHWRTPEGQHHSARGVTAADFNEDGFVDVFVSNYRLQPNHLWINKSGKLAESAESHGARGIPNAVIKYTGGISYPICGHTIGSAWGDLDSDGHIDLFVGNFSHPPGDQDRPQFLRNMGSENGYKFEDKSKHAGLAWQESFASPALADYDNDGDLDLFFTTVYGTGSGGIRNYPVLYRNDGDWKFVDVTEEEGLSKLGPTYQAAWADIDNDGDLDLCSNGRMFRNECPAAGWIQLDLRAAKSATAIGAQVRVGVGDNVVTRQVESGTGEGNQNDLRLHFGLGQLKGPVTARVRWPGGATSEHSLDSNTRHVVEKQVSP